MIHIMRIAKLISVLQKRSDSKCMTSYYIAVLLNSSSWLTLMTNKLKDKPRHVIPKQDQCNEHPSITGQQHLP